MTDSQLSSQDVRRLLEEPSGDIRAETARKLAEQFDASALTPAERKLAEDIFRLMVKDAEVRVREALSRNLKNSALVPRDVAVGLAKDVDSVALPMLQFSEVLRPEDLIEIVRGENPAAQKAVAQRAVVESDVASALAEDGDVEALAALAANPGAEIAESAMHTIVDRFGDDERVQDPLAHRAHLPVTVAERLVTRVSQALQDHILQNHELPANLAADLVMRSRERATISLSSESTEDEVERLVVQMHGHGRLSDSIILRAACMGDLKFFEYALSARTDVPVVNVRALVHDSGVRGLKGVVGEANISDALYPALRAAVDVMRETDLDGGDNDRERYKRRVLERILTQYNHLGATVEQADLDYLLAKIDTFSPSAAA